MEHDRLILALRAERRAQGLTQQETAEKFGQRSYTSVNRWEIGRTDPLLASFVAWADALGFKVTLVRREDLDGA